jgi:hypothetical protein
MSESISFVVYKSAVAHDPSRAHDPARAGFVHIAGNVYRDSSNVYWVQRPAHEVLSYHNNGPATVTDYESFPAFSSEDYQIHFKAISKDNAPDVYEVGSCVIVLDPKHPDSSHRYSFNGTVHAISRSDDLYLIEDQDGTGFWVHRDEMRLDK